MLNFVASYPKSGNTWIRLVCKGYSRGTGQMQVRYDDASMVDMQPVSPIPVMELGVAGEAQVRHAAMIMLARRVHEDTLVKSHHASVQVADIHLWSQTWAGKVINPVRDPRDVCCSAMSHFGFDSYEEAADFLGNENSTIGGDDKLHHVLGSWSKHVGSWLRTDRLDVHTVKYEDLHEQVYSGEEIDPSGFRGILEFLGEEEVDEKRLLTAIEAAKFDRLQKVEEEQGFPETSDHADCFFRKGEVGAWEEELPASVQAQIEEDHTDMMTKMGYL